MLSKFVSLTFRNSAQACQVLHQSVVNCFQNLYLWLSETAINRTSHLLRPLWIAFKICIFDFQKQPQGFVLPHSKSCELLSKFVSLTFRNSLLTFYFKQCRLWIAFKICIFDFQKQPLVDGFFGLLVVNCFQNLYLWLSETALNHATSLNFRLWIAFKICIFDFQKQPIRHDRLAKSSCELLSKFVSLTFRNSNRLSAARHNGVVNCFQNLYLWLSETADEETKAALYELWIAFKICIFDFQKQLKILQPLGDICCELLSKFVSLTFRNSNRLSAARHNGVVNCFQNLYLWLSETADEETKAALYELWIAFKICIFDFQKQQHTGWKDFCMSCELLSKFVSLTFRNSSLPSSLNLVVVVNCFQNLYLWLSETAMNWNLWTRKQLWIAFKICIFDFQKQPLRCPPFGMASCELLSKFVSLTFRNSLVWYTTTKIQLWIAFKICIFDFQKQLQLYYLPHYNSCELLSKFVSLTFRNSLKAEAIIANLLWIAFKICIFDFQKQPFRWLWFKRRVVNCFQNLYLWLSETANGRCNKV